MFCKKCGNELNPSEKFCSKCGTPVGGAAPAAPRQPKQISLSVPQHLKSPMGIMYMVVALFHVLQLMFWTVKCLGNSWFKLPPSYYLTSKDQGFVNVFFVLLGVAAVVICVMPVLMNTVNKARKMIVPLIANVWTLCWFIYIWTDAPLTFCGWLLFFCIIFALLLEVGILLVSNKIIALGK